MSNANTDLNLIKKILKTDNLATLTQQEREEYYLARCEALGLDPLSKPFSYLEMKDGKGGTRTILYFNKNASDQLRGKLKIKFGKPEFKKSDCGEYLQAEVMFELPDGRVEFATAAVPLVKEDVAWNKLPDGSKVKVVKGILQLSPDEKANAVMKLETKLKNRATMSAMGSGMMDESELDTLSDIIVRTIPTQQESAPSKVETPKKTPAQGDITLQAEKDRSIMTHLSKDKLLGSEVTEELFFVHHRNKAEFEERFGVLPSPKQPEGGRFWIESQVLATV
jgi:hypothetical protein